MGILVSLQESVNYFPLAVFHDFTDKVVGVEIVLANIFELQRHLLRIDIEELCVQTNIIWQVGLVVSILTQDPLGAQERIFRLINITSISEAIYLHSCGGMCECNIFGFVFNTHTHTHKLGCSN